MQKLIQLPPFKPVISWILLIVFWLITIPKTTSQDRRKDSLITKIQTVKSSGEYKKDTVYINLLYQLGREFGYQNLDSLLALSKETISLSTAIGFAEGEIKGLLSLGNYYSEIGAQDKAVIYFSDAMRKAQDINNIELILRSKNFLAIENEYLENYALALEQYREGIELAKKNERISWLSSFYINISNLYIEQKDYEQGIAFLTKAKEQNIVLGEHKITAITLANLAWAYQENQDLENALSHVNQSILIFEKLELTDWLTYAYEIRANIYLQKNEFNQALIWFFKSEKIHEAIDQSRYKIPLYNGIAKAYLGLKNYALAEKYAKESLVLIENLNMIEGKEESLKTLYEIKKSTNDYNAALAYFEAYKNTSDSNTLNKNKKDLKILKSSIAFEQEKEKYLLENEKRLSRQRFYFYIALIVILAFALIIFMLKRNSKVKDQLNKKLTIKTEELQKKETHLNNSNNTKSRLFSIIAHDLKGPINSFKVMFDMIGSGAISTNEFIGVIPKMGENIDSIAFTLNNLLSWGQTQMNGMVNRPEATNISTLVVENTSLLSKIAAQKSISLENKVVDTSIAWCDKEQISIVVRNLVSNALKFTPNNGSIRIGTNDRDTFWEVYVKDSGVGLSEEALTKIFQQQETFTTYGTNNEKGTGLGLVLCKDMIEKNGGAIWAESTLNKGTCFYFTLPKGNIN